MQRRERGARRGWMVSARHCTLTLKKRTGTLCTVGWMGVRAGLDVSGKISPPPGFEPQTVQPVASHYTDYSVLGV